MWQAPFDKSECYCLYSRVSGLEMYLHLIKVLEDNYPEMAKRLIVVNGKVTISQLYGLRLSTHALSWHLCFSVNCL